jgi:hypothetical protein
MPIELSSFSRFQGSQPIVRNGKETFGLWVRSQAVNPAQLDQNKIQTIKIDQRLAGRPDIIANDLYGSPLLEWVVIMFNRPQNPLGWPPAGIIIRMPTRDVVLGFL